jgi:hypothetical protein
MRGVVQPDGRIKLIEDDLPDGTIVYVMCEKDLR